MHCAMAISIARGAKRSAISLLPAVAAQVKPRSREKEDRLSLDRDDAETDVIVPPFGLEPQAEG